MHHGPTPRAATQPSEDALQPRLLGSLASCGAPVTALVWGETFWDTQVCAQCRSHPAGERRAIISSPIVWERPLQRGARGEVLGHDGEGILGHPDRTSPHTPAPLPKQRRLNVGAGRERGRTRHSRFSGVSRASALETQLCVWFSHSRDKVWGHLYEMPRILKFIETESGMVFARS